MELKYSPPDPIALRENVRRNWWLRVLIVSFLFGLKGWGQAESAEYPLKAVFLLNFARFVDWPATAFPDKKSPLIIGVLGEDPFGVALDETVRGEHIGPRDLVIRRFRRVREIDVCHILFISKSEAGRLEAITAALSGRSILTVSDAEGAANRGVMIRFVNEKKTIRFRINFDVAKAARLTISSKLLRPAEIVTTEKN